MPENTEVLNKKDDCCKVEEEKNDSGTDSDSDDSIPELEDTGAGGAQTQGQNPLAAAAGWLWRLMGIIYAARCQYLLHVTTICML